MATPPKDKKSDSKPKGKKPGGPPGAEAQPPMGPPVPGMMPGPEKPPPPGTPIDPFEAMAMGGGAGAPPMDPALMGMLMGAGGGVPGMGTDPFALGGMPMGMGPLPGGISGNPADPYMLPPGYPDQALSGAGMPDPNNLQLQQLLQLLALAQGGVSQGGPVNSSGVLMDPSSDIMAGMDPAALLPRTGGF